MECTRKMYFLNICYQFPLIIKILLVVKSSNWCRIHFFEIKFLNFVCKNSKLKNESTSSSLPIILREILREILHYYNKQIHKGKNIKIT